MALERERIEKKDFPVGRRGYDPDAVDTHLREIADEVDQLQRSATRRTESLASAASEQVRTIVEAAEKSAAEIQERVEQEARDIRNEAKRDARRERSEAAQDAQRERDEAAAAAQAEREQATGQGREYVSRVSEATSQMLERLKAMDTELGTLTDTLHTGATRLKAELDLLESELKEASAATLQPPVAEAVPAAEPEAAEQELYEDAAVEAEAEEVTGTPEMVEAEEEEAGAGPEGEPDDAEGARLIALNMALNGTPREETDRYLAENFELADRGQLLDEVYASVEG